MYMYMLTLRYPHHGLTYNFSVFNYLLAALYILQRKLMTKRN